MPSPKTSSLVCPSVLVLVLTHSFNPLTWPLRPLTSSSRSFSSRRSTSQPSLNSSRSAVRTSTSALSSRSSVSVRRNCWLSVLCLACQNVAVSLSFWLSLSSSFVNSRSIVSISRSR